MFCNGGKAAAVEVHFQFLDFYLRARLGRYAVARAVAQYGVF